MIVPNPYFNQKVKGQVRAELVLDQNQTPITTPGKSFNHYKIKLFLENADPAVQRVIYKLDPTYYDPVRESSDAQNQFGIFLSTYGDYPVTFDIQMESELIRTVVSLSELLNETHGQSNNEKIQTALREIKAH